jgi:TetR/AcrR family transcriptional regulator, repressor for uid operon
MTNVDQIPGAPDRKARIIEAAARCFVRTGFHKTTMQDVAAECGMSPGNLYRYFPSKDAIVAGLAELDRERLNADFIALQAAADPVAAFVALGHQHLVEEPRDKAILMMEIWAESCRNPRIAELCAAMDANVLECMTIFIAQWRAAENVEGIGSPRDVARLIIAMGDGLARSRATDSAFDPEGAFALALPVIARMIGVDGLLPPSPKVSS